MGQKTHPTGFRIAITEPWRSRWYATKKDFSKNLVEDFKIRKFIKDNWAFAAIPKVEIERTGELVTVFLHTARPGILIGKKGAKVDKFREDLEKLTKKDFSKHLVEDFKIRKFIKDNWAFAAIPKVEIERTGELVTVFLHTARPGILIGKKGAKVDKFREDLEKLTKKPVRMKIIEIHRPELEAHLVAESLGEQLNKRMNYRRALKKVADTSMAAGAKGIKIQVSGRLQGSEMARVGQIRKGRIPCTTLRAQLDFGIAVSKTKYGTIGVKVWIFKGELGPGETTNGLLPVRTAAEKAGLA